MAGPNLRRGHPAWRKNCDHPSFWKNTDFSRREATATAAAAAGRCGDGQDETRPGIILQNDPPRPHMFRLGSCDDGALWQDQTCGAAILLGEKTATILLFGKTQTFLKREATATAAAGRCARPGIILQNDPPRPHMFRLGSCDDGAYGGTKNLRRGHPA